MTSARSCRPGPKSVASRDGFTLVEMLVVLAIIAILAVLALPAIKGVLGSIDMKGAANLVGAQLDLARQTASTRNVQVDVRIYQDSAVLDPNAGNVAAYRIIAVVIPAAASGAASDEFVSPGVALPGDIIFDQTVASPTSYSTLLDPSAANGDPQGNSRFVAMEATTAPLLVQGKPYMKFTFLANGSVYLNNTSTQSGTWCLSMRNLHAPAVTGANAAPAKNFICLVLDPTTSRARVYQP
jgi:uncharacterized protein (TIGR02596 family)